MSRQAAFSRHHDYVRAPSMSQGDARSQLLFGLRAAAVVVLGTAAGVTLLLGAAHAMF